MLPVPCDLKLYPNSKRRMNNKMKHAFNKRINGLHILMVTQMKWDEFNMKPNKTKKIM